MTSLELVVAGARAEDAGRGVARLDPADLARMGAATGAVIAISGSRTAYARALPLHPSERGRALVQMDGATRANAAASIGETVRVAAGVATARAEALTLEGSAARLPAAMLRRALAGIPLCAGDSHRLPLVGGREAALVVRALRPDGPAFCDEATEILGAPTAAAPRDSDIRYEDLGGLGRVLEQIREVVELPLRNPAAFDHLGIAPPKGILLVGPPGTGKTMIARAVAAESRAHFIAVNGPEIVDRYYGASEQALRGVFETARKQAPAVIFIDEIDAIAPRRGALSGEKQVERRIVAQLLTLMDGLADRGAVVVLAATNLPDDIDPALRRPGRFDREIRIDPPDRAGRREVLAVHSRAMPLAADVDLDALAEATHGHVGADLAAVCREAALAALRRAGGLSIGAPPPDLASLRVTAADFAQALRMVTPTALREVFVEIPNVRWADVAGVAPIRDTLVRAIDWPLRHPALFARLGVSPVRGVLLHGRPGTGKTLLARALATEVGAGFISVRGPELLTQWQGASERALREIFARARTAAPCILFFDEIDAIAGARGTGEGANPDRMVAQLLTEMDGIAAPPGVVVLGATNRADRLDPALLRPGRFDLVLEMPLPDAAARRAILAIHAAGMPVAPDVDLDALARATEGLVGADLAGLCRLAALAALDRFATAAPEAMERITVAAGDFAAGLRRHREGRTWPAG